MSAAVLLQESLRGRVAICPVWIPVAVGDDPGPDGFRIRNAGLAPRHCELTAEADGRVRVGDPTGAGVWLNGVRVTGAAHAGVGDLLRLGAADGRGGADLLVIGLLDPARPSRDRGLPSLPLRLEPHHLLLREVGRGAAGIVYEAYDARANRRVAIKLLIAGGRAHPELIARFRREAALQARLKDYPGIVSVYDVGIAPDTGELYCVMEYVTGATLREKIRAGLPRTEGARVMARVARAVDYAHRHGLIHRDLKPRNVMVSARNVIRLMDFGLCKALEEDDGLTTTGVTLGTPCYMAPEQIEDAKHVGPEADVYSLGAIFYVVLTGALPFAGETVPEVLEKVATGDMVLPRALDPTIPAELEALILETMSRDPARRPASAMAFAKRIEDWVRREDPPRRVSLAPPSV